MVRRICTVLSKVGAFHCRHFHEGIINTVMNAHGYRYNCRVCARPKVGQWR